MPTVRRFQNCKISVYANDHHPPHFHIEARGYSTLVEIERFNVSPDARRRYREAVEWAEENKKLLLAEFVRLNEMG